MLASVLDRLKVFAVVRGHWWRNERWTARRRSFALFLLAPPKMGCLAELTRTRPFGRFGTESREQCAAAEHDEHNREGVDGIKK